MTERGADLRRPADLRDILGLRTPISFAIITTLVVVMVFGASQSLDGMSVRWPVLIVAALMAAATVALITAPHDPLPLGAATAMALAPPVAAAILLTVVPAPMAIANQVWVSAYATLIYVFMCLRGRFVLVWLSVVASIGVHAAWSEMTDQGIWVGARIPIYNAGAVLAVTMIAYAIRSTTSSILSLRVASEQRAAHAAAIAAAQQERKTRLAELGQLARPLLERIATGVPLTDNERQSCELLEAHLRDQLRASALVTPETASAAAAARARGVEVMLIDDGGLEGVSEPIKTAIHREVAAALRGADDGEVRVRVLPPGRPILVTIYQRTEVGTTRIDINTSGHRATNTPAQRFPEAASDI